MNSKSSFVAVIICGLILSALILRKGEVLLLAAPFVVYLIIGILQSPDEMQIKVTRSVQETEVVAQQPVEVRVVVENAGGRLASLLLADSPPAGLRIVGGHIRQRLQLQGGENTGLRYVAVARRGLYAWNVVHARASDPCGLFEVGQDIPAPAEIRVRAAPMKFRRAKIRPQFTLHTPGPMPARRAGNGTDFWGVREYKAGDPLNRLNWRLASRYPGQLFTNEFEGEEIADFGFIVDARRLTRAYEVEQALFEASISAAASLSETFLHQGNRVALLIFGEATSYLLPGYGKRQLNLVRRELAGAKLGRNLSFHYLEYFPTRLFPSRSVILAFSAVDARDVETYARLRSFGYDILLISPDPVGYQSRMLQSSPINELAVRAARVERSVQLKRLMNMGVTVIDWQISQPLDTILEKTGSHMAHRRNI